MQATTNPLSAGGKKILLFMPLWSLFCLFVRNIFNQSSIKYNTDNTITSNFPLKSNYPSRQFRSYSSLRLVAWKIFTQNFADFLRRSLGGKRLTDVFMIKVHSVCSNLKYKTWGLLIQTAKVKPPHSLNGK